MRNGLLLLGAAVVLGFGVSGDAQTSGPTLKKVSAGAAGRRQTSSANGGLRSCRWSEVRSRGARKAD
jgi:hypothetical protein